MRKCACSGQCGSASDGYSRREFIELVGAGTAGALLAPDLRGDFAISPQAFEEWKKSLFAQSHPRLYSSVAHTDARMHLGGIGTGNFEIGADGQFTTWQLFNTLRDGHVPLYFALKVGKVARLLQTAGGPSWPRVARIEMTGEYPVAELRFIDDALPVQAELVAFSPFVPLDTRTSSMPLAALVFRVTNPTPIAQSVSIAAFMQNPIGYDARGALQENRHPGLGSNVNVPLVTASVSGLSFGAVAGSPAAIDTPVTLFAGDNLQELNSPPADRPDGLRLKFIGADGADLGRLTAAESTVVWIEDAPDNLSELLLRTARDAVHAGATLVFGGCDQALLRAYGAFTGGKPIDRVTSRPDILFEDFERGYGDWKVEGTAFGNAPASGTLPNQQRVSGFSGKGLVNTYLGGDDTEGRLVSKPFRIERYYVRFLVGGGRHANTQVRLIVDGKVARATSGKDNEKLDSALWDVREFAGRNAHIEIVDAQKGGWGHINVDHIVFSDDPANRAAFDQLEQLLPIRFSGLRSLPDSPQENRHVEFENLSLQPDSNEQHGPGGLGLFVRTLGKGKVVLAAGSILVPGEAGFVTLRQRAYQFLCELAGARFSPCGGQHPLSMGFGGVGIGVLTEHVRSSTDDTQHLSPELTALVAFDSWNDAWDRFAYDGKFDPLAGARPCSPTPAGTTTRGSIAVSLTVPAGASVDVPFIVAWRYPNKYSAAGLPMGCHYATLWPDTEAILREAAASWALLRDKTEQFRRAFHSNTLPWWLMDCVSANAAIIRHVGVVFRIANGDVYGWEGSNGCCQPTCTHVWGYEQTLAHLFPDLEREMRRIDFKHQQRPDGGVNNRTEVPSPPHPTGEHPFADGHASCILKAYREALCSTDERFFQDYWPHVRKAVDYLVQRDAAVHSGQPAGYLEDDQWNTYDEALHGVTTFISGYYLAALRAGEAWARRLGNNAIADRWHEVLERGRNNLVNLCWNGEYFQQHLPGYEGMPGEVGPGCMSDQLIGQWWAHQLGLGYILPREKVVQALQAVFRYNFKTDLTGWKHAPRAFAGAGDKGLIICTWPKGGRPRHVMLYSDEVWTGIEYQVAAHMIYEGLVEEGLALVKAARDRYDGLPRTPITRNPWNEIECGGHYARAMSSWSLLTALTGWEYDGPRAALRIGPSYSPQSLRAFWCASQGWGTFAQEQQGHKQQNEFSVVWGVLRLRQLTVATNEPPRHVRAELNGKQVQAQIQTVSDGVRLSFADGVQISADQQLVLTMTP